MCAWILALNLKLISCSPIYSHRARGREERIQAKTEREREREREREDGKAMWTMLANPQRSRSNGGQRYASWIFLEPGPKVFLPPDLWIFRLEETKSSCPEERKKKSHTDPSLIRRVGFWETGGDRTLVQQAISLPGGRITHKWTDCIAKKKKKKNIPPFQVVPTGFSLHCSLLLSFSLLLWPHIFFVCPAGNELLSRLLPPFLPLVSFFYPDWQVRILVKVGCLSLPFFLSLLFFSFFFLARSAVELTELWQLWITAHHSSQSHCDDLVSRQSLTGRDEMMMSSLSVIFPTGTPSSLDRW